MLRGTRISDARYIRLVYENLEIASRFNYPKLSEFMAGCLALQFSLFSMKGSTMQYRCASDLPHSIWLKHAGKQGLVEGRRRSMTRSGNVPQASPRIPLSFRNPATPFLRLASSFKQRQSKLFSPILGLDPHL